MDPLAALVVAEAEYIVAHAEFYDALVDARIKLEQLHGLLGDF